MQPVQVGRSGLNPSERTRGKLRTNSKFRGTAGRIKPRAVVSVCWARRHSEALPPSAFHMPELNESTLRAQMICALGNLQLTETGHPAPGGDRSTGRKPIPIAAIVRGCVELRMHSLELGTGVVFGTGSARQHHASEAGGGEFGRDVHACPQVNAETISHSLHECAAFVDRKSVV